MEEIIKDIWNYKDMADTYIILSTLLPIGDRAAAINRISINADYRRLVSQWDYAKKCIYLADMEPEGPGKDFFPLTDVYFVDDPMVHPTVSGAQGVVRGGISANTI